ncbi:hypothetical protein EZI54_10655 [Marinobacter halodurans]|uniref:Nucleoside-diphosphate sugar epimerase n=1 Tax=Marinobacter halodurans TaxID=2528979 RepID=A0ABY1ZK59_9GAMM|nr:ELM1/GtrOC1 family putative glycosyltransferase [Marinobacter halodurans]TBW55893.1 hypothetical protein EZI54_10655 [Marinobacter halodurans]
MTHGVEPLVTWLIHDDKPGHRNQLRGLANRLAAHADVRCHWIDALSQRVPRWRALMGLRPRLDVPDGLHQPGLIVAAGTGTHRLLLALRRTRRARTALLMRPSFPQQWIDCRIIPHHDRPSPSPGTLVTIGVLNTMTPMAHLTKRQHGVILIGGPSRHYRWDNAAILQQLARLLRAYPGWQWTVTSSRRSPEELIAALRERQGPLFRFRDHRDTHDRWLAHTLADSRAAWITPDSASMVYESLTAGIPTGLFGLTPVSGSRVAAGVEALLEQRRAHPLSEAQAVMSATTPITPPLWEADRAARWLLERCRGVPS